jgi:hypothetical protein
MRPNIGRSFIGCDIKGQGFLFADDDPEATLIGRMRELVRADPRNADRIMPYIGGSEINDSPVHANSRWVIDFHNLSRSEAEHWPDLFHIVEEKVRPERLKKSPELVDWPFWQFWRTRDELRRASTGLAEVLAIAQTGNVLGFAFVRQPMVFSHTVVVFPSMSRGQFAVLQYRVHEVWSRMFAATMKDDARYIPRDCFETFPFPPGYEADVRLEAIGQTYHNHRAKLMLEANEGMTKTYNRFHKQDETGVFIQRLRELHDEMDCAVLRAYGWDDLAYMLKPEFLTEETEDDHTYQGRYFWPAAQRDLVLSRLLALNAERYEEEVRQGLHEKGRKHAKEEDDELELEAEGE